MKFSICNEVFGNQQSLQDWQAICEFVAAAGYDGIEVAPFTFAPNVEDIDADTRREIRDIAESSGLDITALHWLLVSPPGLHINAIDDETRIRTVDYMRSLIGFAADIGAPTMIFGSPKARFIEDDFDSAFMRTVDSYRQLLPDLEGYNVTLCQEALPPPECDFLLHTEAAWEMVEAVNHPNFQLMLDVKSMCAEKDILPNGKTPTALTREYGSRARHFHANDVNRRAPGYGDVDFGPILQALQRVEYDNWVSLEPFDYFPDPQTLAVESLGYLKFCLEALED